MLVENQILGQVDVPTFGASSQITICTGKPLFILGRNGTGKSALVHFLSTQFGTNIVYLPGSRPNYFDSESLTLTLASRRDLQSNLRGWDQSPDSRWRSISGTQRNEKAIHDLQTAETQFKVDAANEIKEFGASAAAIKRLQSDASPLDKVNNLLAQANLSVQLLISGGELRSQQNGNIYSYARMSDGERSALLFASEVVAALPGTIFLIDEPELHLHPSIVVPLLASFIKERADCAFVVCTHELSLPIVCDGDVVLVRSGRWDGGTVRAWDLDVIHSGDPIPESFKIDILGSRNRILFTEGRDLSMDIPLYALLFPRISLIAKESCKEVMRAVDGLRATETLHRSMAFGIIDNDGMSPENKSSFEQRGIFPLQLFSVESLYYSEAALREISFRQAETLGTSAEELIETAKASALNSIDARTVEHLAGRVAERQLRDLLARTVPSRSEMVAGHNENIEFSFSNPYRNEVNFLKGLLAEKNLDAIVRRYPVRESGILDNLAKAMKFVGRADYEKAVLQAVRTNVPLKLAMKQNLGVLGNR